MYLPVLLPVEQLLGQSCALCCCVRLLLCYHSDSSTSHVVSLDIQNNADSSVLSILRFFPLPNLVYSTLKANLFYFTEQKIESHSHAVLLAQRRLQLSLGVVSSYSGLQSPDMCLFLQVGLTGGSRLLSASLVQLV